MEIVNSVVRKTTSVSGKRVDRDLVVQIEASSVAQARADAVERLEREHPEATFEVVAHEVIKRPTSGTGGGVAFWTKLGVYRVSLRATGLLEELA